MKKFITMIVVALAYCIGAMAQADKVCGVYKAEQSGTTSKVKIFRNGGGYRAQVIWTANPKNADGSYKTDVKNPDASKRSVHVDNVVLIDKVTYNAQDKVWDGGKIYDPTSGKVYKVELSLKDAKTLVVKGMWGPFSKKVYWTRVQ